MGNARVAPSPLRWAQVATVTALVAVCPVAVVWWLHGSGAISAALPCALLGMALSLGASQVGRLLWEKQPGSEDLLFSELMIWGFLHRLHTQRRLASALDTLGQMSHSQREIAGGLSTAEQAKLLERLVTDIETRDPYLHGHSRRVARHSWMIARRMGLSGAEVARIRTAAAIHDVGKIETPKAVLHKKGKLDDEEYETIKKHPDDGAAMADVLHDVSLTAMVRHHHERLDGSGYPSGLAGAEIPLGARIIAVADTFDAITSTRPYRAASPHKKAIDILREEAGTRLDGDVVRAFCSHYAGRRPLTAWASVAGLPERILSWLGGNLSSVASAAKVSVVAALVAGAAVAGTTIAGNTRDGSRRATSVPAAQARTIASAAASEQAPIDAATPVHALSGASGRSLTGTGARGRSRPASPTPASLPPASSAASGAAQPAPQAPPASAPGSAQAPAGGSEDPRPTPTAEGHGKGEEKGGAQGHGESGKSHEEAHGKATGAVEETVGKTKEGLGKTKEVLGKTEETLGKTTEAVVGKTEETVGKTKEVLGRTEETVNTTKEVVVGKTEEVLGKTKEVLGKLKK
jgi:HD superfamily phosphodiesterase